MKWLQEKNNPTQVFKIAQAKLVRKLPFPPSPFICSFLQVMRAVFIKKKKLATSIVHFQVSPPTCKHSEQNFYHWTTIFSPPLLHTLLWLEMLYCRYNLIQALDESFDPLQSVGLVPLISLEPGFCLLFCVPLSPNFMWFLSSCVLID